MLNIELPYPVTHDKDQHNRSEKNMVYINRRQEKAAFGSQLMMMMIMNQFSQRDSPALSADSKKHNADYLILIYKENRNFTKRGFLPTVKVTASS